MTNNFRKRKRKSKPGAMPILENADALVAAKGKARPNRNVAVIEALLLFGIATDFAMFQVKSTSASVKTKRVDAKYFSRKPGEDTFSDLPLSEGGKDPDPKRSRTAATNMVSQFYPAKMRASLVQLRATEPALFEDLVTAKEGKVPAVLQRLAREVAASYPDEAAGGADEGGTDEAASGADEGGTDEAAAGADEGDAAEAAAGAYESGTDAPAAVMVPV
jgi:hypothetical protein